MKNIAICIGIVVLIGLSSCSNSATLNTSTPEEFGKTLLKIIKNKDSVAFNQLIANKEDFLKFMESTEKYKSVKAEDKAIVIAIINAAVEARNQDMDDLAKSVYLLHKKAERIKIASFENAEVVEVISEETKEENIFWIKTIVEINGKYYNLLCKDAMLIPGKGFRIRANVPWLNEYNPDKNSKK